MCRSLGHLPLKSPAWTDLLPKGDQVLGDVHLEGVLPAPPRDGLQEPVGLGKHSQVLLEKVG